MSLCECRDAPSAALGYGWPPCAGALPLAVASAQVLRSAAAAALLGLAPHLHGRFGLCPSSLLRAALQVAAALRRALSGRRASRLVCCPAFSFLPCPTWVSRLCVLSLFGCRSDVIVAGDLRFRVGIDLLAAPNRCAGSTWWQSASDFKLVVVCRCASMRC